MATTRRPRADIKADVALVEELDALKPVLGTCSRTSTIRALLVEHRKGEQAPKTDLPIVDDAVLNEIGPTIIAGPSGGGKTFAIKRLLGSWRAPVFILDISDEYPDFKKIGLGQFYSHRWREGGRIRFVPSSKISANSEGSAVLVQLAALLSQQAHPLREWALVLEEADRFVRDVNFKTILSEGRKGCAKILVPLQRWTTFKLVAPVFRVPPTKQRNDGGES